ncbi:hypothetical protein K438DRAFT_1277318 [Mycena galopus ATCC 62051]|nr:hypothetical protein K438DRAFT_1277318 [Mycena galopus ATCC 62051]
MFLIGIGRLCSVSCRFFAPIWDRELQKRCCRSWAANALSPTSKRGGAGPRFFVSISNCVSMHVP